MAAKRILTLICASVLLGLFIVSIARVGQIGIVNLLLLAIALLIFFLDSKQSNRSGEIAAAMYGIPGLLFPLMLLAPSGDAVLEMEMIDYYLFFALGIASLSAALICRKA